MGWTLLKVGTDGSTSSSVLGIVPLTHCLTEGKQGAELGRGERSSWRRRSWQGVHHPEQAGEEQGLVMEHGNCCPSQGWPRVYTSGISSGMKLPALSFLWPFGRTSSSPHSASVQRRKKDPFLKTRCCHLLGNCHKKCKNLPRCPHRDALVQSSACTIQPQPYLPGSSLLPLKPV